MAAMRATDPAVRRVSRPGRGPGRLGSVIVAAGGSVMAVIGYRPVLGLGRHRDLIYHDHFYIRRDGESALRTDVDAGPALPTRLIKFQSTRATPRRKCATRDRSITRTDQPARHLAGASTLRVPLLPTPLTAEGASPRRDRLHRHQTGPVHSARLIAGAAWWPASRPDGTMS